MGYEEIKVSLDKGVVGVYTRPFTDEKSPTILLLHGFASHKNEVGDMFQKLTAALAGKEIGSLRIDFRGNGESNGDFADTTIARQWEDAQHAVQFLRTRADVDQNRLGILGFSLGAAIAVLTAARNPELFNSLVLWSPTGDLENVFRQTLGEENFAAANQHGAVTIDLGWRSVRLKRGFFDSLMEFSPLQEIAQYPGALLAIAGSEDRTAASARDYVKNAQRASAEVVIIQGADHIFNVLSVDQGIANTVIDQTCRWLFETLSVIK